MNEFKKSFSPVSGFEHFCACLMDTNLFGVSKVENREGSTVDGEERSHAEDVTVKVGRSLWITDAEADVIELPAYGWRWLRRICSWNWRWHGGKEGGFGSGVDCGQQDPADAGILSRRSQQIKRKPTCLALLQLELLAPRPIQDEI